MKNRLAALVFLSFVASPSVSRADETLELPVFLERVRTDGAMTRALVAPVAVAEARRGVAGLRPAPGLEVGLAQLDISGQGAPTSSIVGVAIPIELGGDRGARLVEARARRDLTTSDSARDVGALLLEAAIAFVDAIEAEELAAVHRSSLASVERLATLDEARLAGGEVTEVDYLRAAVERDRLAAELQHFEGEARARREALRGFLGVDAGPVIPTLHVAADEASADEASWLAIAYESRHEMAVARDRMAVAEAERDRVRAARVPDAFLRFAWTHNGSTSVTQFRQHANDILAVTLGLPMPFANRRRADVGVAEAGIDEADAATLAIRTRIAAEVRTAFAEHEGAHARHAAFEGGVAERAARLAERTQHAYDRDAATVLELLASRRAADEIEASRVAARAEHARARLRLEAAARGTVDGL